MWMRQVRARSSVWCLAALILTGLPACVVPASAASGTRKPVHTEIDERKTAPDGVTSGWVLTYDNPDPDRAWERIPATLVIARHRHVLHRWEFNVVRGWEFWQSGQAVAVEVGGLHGATACLLLSTASGRHLAVYPAAKKAVESCGADNPHKPAWARTLEP